MGTPHTHIPSGLFPSGGPPRPRYREPHPVRAKGLAAGFAAGLGWLLLFGLLGSGVSGYVGWTVVAGVAAWAVALTLVRYGDRGVAVGVAVATAVGWAAAAAAVVSVWAVTGAWPLW